MCRVLDIGTGDGTWLVEMATEYPDVQFVGCDIVDIMNHSPTPSNCRWEQGSILQGLPHSDDSFDLIHQRQIGCYITEKQWPSVARELYRLCRPGGRVFLVELEQTMNSQIATATAVSNPNTIDAANKEALVQLNIILGDALRQSSVNPDAIRHLDKLLEHVGFTGVHHETIAIPCGGWGGPLGRSMMRHLQMTMSAGTATALAVGRISRAEYDALVEMAVPLLGTEQSYHNLHIFVAEKPLGPGDRSGVSGGGRLNSLRREVLDGVHRIGSTRRQGTRLR
ncbi:S-adenosyl-L-methionine-dependent methyltransferase [Syncephalis fuscata]|nr:S-adenosyl-L-methionine-dependent methyltransferase [Syncephalis fuscata]